MHGLCILGMALVVTGVTVDSLGQYPPLSGVYSIPVPEEFRAASLLRAGPGLDPMCVASSNDSSEVTFFRTQDGNRLVPAGTLGFGSAGYVEFWVRDLDADGDDDVLVATSGPGQIAVVLQEQGALVTRAVIPAPVLTGPGNLDVVAGDFDANGLTDVGLVLSGSVQVFLASGPWEYGAPISAVVSDVYRPATVFDLDGIPGDEIIGSNSNGVSVVSVRDSGLTQFNSPSVGYRPEFVHAGVLRAGDAAEVLVADRRNETTRVDTLRFGDGQLLLGGGGVFGGGLVAHLTVADIDDDGLADVLVSGDVSGVYYGIDAGPDALSFESDPLALSGELSGLADLQAVGAFDLNGDGMTEFVGRTRHSFAVFLGDGQRFRTHVLGTTINPAGVSWLVPYPSDDPEWPALLGLGNDGPVVVSAMLPDGSPSDRLLTRLDPRIPVYGRSRVLFGDINADGRSDYVGIVNPSASLVPSFLFWAVGDGSGEYGTPVVRDVSPSGTTAIMLHDLDRDGFDDAILETSAWLAVLRGRPSGIFATEIEVPIPFMHGFGFLCDLDGDGFQDVIRLAVEGDLLQVLYGSDGMQFGPAIEFLLPRESPLSGDGTYPLVDLNGDGVIDLVTPTRAGFAVAVSSGARSYRQFEQVLIPGGGGRADIRAGDLDGDTYPELVYSNGSGVTVLGLGVERGLEIRGSIVGMTGFAVLDDMDGDGATDILVSNDDATICYINSGAVRCLADYAPDGVLNFFDVTLFLNDLVGGVRFADLNRDGLTNFLDLALLLNRFGEGCPE